MNQKTAAPIKIKKAILKSNDLLPRHIDTHAFQVWLQAKTNSKLTNISSNSFSADVFKRNIENYIGTAQIPIGIAGPLKVCGSHASGLYYVPFATTEGVLVDSYHRGMLAVTQSGGADVVLLQDRIDTSPIFILQKKSDFANFIDFLNKEFTEIKRNAEQTSKHGKLIKITPFPLGATRIVVIFYYSTGDAMGLNMINVATEAACKYIRNRFPIRNYFLRSNFESDKKTSYHNILEGYGKTLIASVFLSEAILRNYLRTTSKNLYEFWLNAFLSSDQAGMVGKNAQFANGLAAIYVATGQDVAQIVNASNGVTYVEKVDDGIDFSVKVPSLVCGTVGGGTNLPTQKECLSLMSCSAAGSAKKFSEIVCAALLAGEISIFAALSSGQFIQAHDRKRKLT